jgi:thiol:disulfide interchange protein
MKLYFAIQTLFVRTVVYLWKRVLPFVAGLFLVGALSFVFTGGFSFLKLSERVFYEAVIVFLIGGTVAMSHMVSGRTLLFPYNIRRPEDAKKYVEQQPTFHAAREKRLDVGIQLWLIALGTLGISALIQTLLT